MYYVIYSPRLGKYLDDEQHLVGYENAARFRFIEDANEQLTQDFRVVGPCEEGDEPR